MKKEELLIFLKKIDSLFPIKLSDKTDLSNLTEKFLSLGTIFSISENNEIVGLIAGYNNDILNHNAYISVLAVLPEYQGRGYASTLLIEFEKICKQKNMRRIEVYTHKTNFGAIKMYKKNNYVVDNSNTQRPDDIKFYKEL